MKAIHDQKNLLHQQLAPQCAMLKGDRTYHIAQLPSPYSIVGLFEVTKVVPTEPKLVIMRKLKDKLGHSLVSLVVSGHVMVPSYNVPVPVMPSAVVINRADIFLFNIQNYKLN